MSQTQVEELLAIPEYTKLEKVKMVLKPDRTEIILFFIAFVINYIILALLFSKELFLGSVNEMNTSFFGLLLMVMYGTRWGYLSADDYQRKLERLMLEHLKGNKLVPTIKFPGLITGIFFLFGGLYFFKYVYYLLNPTLGPVLLALNWLLNFL